MDNLVSQPVDAWRLRRKRKQKPCIHFLRGNCWKGNHCNAAHILPSDLQTCEQYRKWLIDPWRNAPCSRSTACLYPHVDCNPPLTDGANVVLQCPQSHLGRVATLADKKRLHWSAEGGSGNFVVSKIRGGTGKHVQCAVLVSAPGVATFVNAIASDLFAARCIPRIYRVDAGVASSLRDAGMLAVDALSTVFGSDPRFLGIDAGGPEDTRLAGKRKIRARLQAFPSPLEGFILNSGAEEFLNNANVVFAVKCFDAVISIVYVRGQYLVGANPGGESYNQGRALSEEIVSSTQEKAFVGSTCRSPRPVTSFVPPTRNEVVCRAYYKLREVCVKSGIECNDSWNVLDIGASPGGWTRYLAEMCPAGRVYAVDPGSLHDDVLALDNVTHLSLTIQQALSRIVNPRQKANRVDDEADVGVPLPRELDMIVCDVNMQPSELWPILKCFLSNEHNFETFPGKASCTASPPPHRLRRGGHIIFTLKDFCDPFSLKGTRQSTQGKAANMMKMQQSRIVRDMRTMFASPVEIHRLLSGRRKEVTVVGKGHTAWECKQSSFDEDKRTLIPPDEAHISNSGDTQGGPDL